MPLRGGRRPVRSAARLGVPRRADRGPRWADGRAPGHWVLRSIAPPAREVIGLVLATRTVKPATQPVFPARFVRNQRRAANKLAERRRYACSLGYGRKS